MELIMDENCIESTISNKAYFRSLEVYLKISKHDNMTFIKDILNSAKEEYINYARLYELMYRIFCLLCLSSIPRKEFDMMIADYSKALPFFKRFILPKNIGFKDCLEAIINFYLKIFHDYIKVIDPFNCNSKAGIIPDVADNAKEKIKYIKILNFMESYILMIHCNDELLNQSLLNLEPCKLVATEKISFQTGIDFIDRKSVV